MKPYDIQKDFLCAVLNNDKNIQNKNMKIYQELILYRFKEVLNSTYPMFTKYINKEVLEKLIKDFIYSGCSTSYVWKISSEFKDYLYSNRLLNNIQKSIIEFESKQISIYVRNEDIKCSVLSYKRAYRLSVNTSVMMFDYDILNESFSKEKQYILIYKNKDDFQVYYLSISKFLYHFFKYQRGNNTINKAIYFASKKANIDYKDAKDIAKETIENFISDGILI